MTAQASHHEEPETFLPAGMTHSGRRMVAFAVSLSAVLSVMESTVVSAVLPSITQDLGGLSLYRWLAAGYLLATAVTVPVYGRLADVYGRRPMFFWSLFIFMVGSVACGAAPNIDTLIAFRVLQGLGAGGLQVVATTILTDIYTPAERARIQGWMSMVWGSAAAAGPLLGTAILQFASWRWAFYVNVPVAIPVFLLIHRNYIDTHAHTKHRFDIVGFLLLSVGISGLLLSAGDHLSVPGLLASLVVLALFVWHERRAPEPLLPLNIAWRPGILRPSVGAALLSGALFGLVTYLPLYSSLHTGGSVANAGLILAPLLIGAFLGSLACSRIAHHFSLRTIAYVGSGIAALAAIANVAMVYADAPVLASRINLLIFGIGYGTMMLCFILIVQNAAARAERGTANAVFALARSLGVALAVGLLGSVLAANTAATGGIDPATAHSLLGSLHVIFIAIAVISVAGFFFTVSVPTMSLTPPRLAAVAAKDDDISEPFIEI